MYYFDQDGCKKLFKRTDLGGCFGSHHFYKYFDESGFWIKGAVGKALATCINAKDEFEVWKSALANHYEKIHCDNPDCINCNLLKPRKSFFLFKLAEKMWVRKTGFCLSCMALMGTLCAFLFAYVQKNYYFNEMQAVTLQSEKTFSNPSATSKAMKELHEGVLLNIEQRQSDGWMQVTLPDGTACWLKSNNLLMLND